MARTASQNRNPIVPLTPQLVNMKKFFFIFLFIVCSSSALLCVAHAQGPLSSGLENLDKAATSTHLSDDLPGTVALIVRGVLSVLGTIFFCLTVYAGVIWMTAMGNSEAVEKSRSVLSAAVIGLAITLAAYAITVFVGSRLGT